MCVPSVGEVMGVTLLVLVCGMGRERKGMGWCGAPAHISVLSLSRPVPFRPYEPRTEMFACIPADVQADGRMNNALDRDEKNVKSKKKKREKGDEYFDECVS